MKSPPRAKVLLQFGNKCPTNFSLSPGFDKLKLVGHQTASLPRAKAQLLLGVFVQDFFEPEMSIQAIVVRLNVEEQH